MTLRLLPMVFNICHIRKPCKQVKESILAYEVDVLAQLLGSIIGVVSTPIGEEGVFDKTSADRSGYRIFSFEADQGLYSVGRKLGVIHIAIGGVDVLHDNMPNRYSGERDLERLVDPRDSQVEAWVVINGIGDPVLSPSL